MIYATALESVYPCCADCREDVAVSRFSVELTDQYTDPKLKIQADPAGDFLCSTSRSCAGTQVMTGFDFAGKKPNIMAHF
jgi:hypothetical protein